MLCLYSITCDQLWRESLTSLSCPQAALVRILLLSQVMYDKNGFFDSCERKRLLCQVHRCRCVSVNTPTELIWHTAPALASLGHCGKNMLHQTLLWFVSTTASASAGSSDCGRQICIQRGQDDLLDVVNLRPRHDLLPRYEFTIGSYLILLGRE